MRQIPRKALSLFLSLVLLCGLCVPSAFAVEGKYSDTQGHWAEAAIERWSEYGIVEGNNGRFNPNASLTRAQMAKVLANTLGLTETVANPFSDVSESDWFAPYVIRCYAAGVMMGDNGKANPNATITRQQAMVMLCRALGIAPVKNPDLSAYTDSGKVGAWAAPYVAAMVESGIVGGIGNGQLAPGGNLSRAALMTILDRSVVQYINEPGTYELVNKDGIILVAAGKVTLTGKTPADILVTPAADGKTLTFDKATVTGSITVQADNAKITSKNSKLPDIAMTGEGSKVETSKPASSGSSGGGSSSGGNSGSSTPSYSSLTVTESQTVSSGTYQNVTITDAVDDGEVTLQNLTINGDLTVQGGGSNSIKLKNCIVRGKVIMAKAIGETPRLELTNTPIAKVEAQKPAIIEAVDTASTVSAVEAKADVEVKGEQTTVAAITVPAAMETSVAVTITAGTVEKLEVKSNATVNAEGTVAAVTAEAPVTVASGSVGTVTVPASVTAPVTVTVGTSASVETVEAKGTTTVTAETNAVVGTVTAEAPVTVSSGKVNTITVPETASSAVNIQVNSGAAVAEVAVSSTAGAAITNNGTVSNVSAANEEAQRNITTAGSSSTPTASTHIHTWNSGTETTAPTCTVAGTKTVACTVADCGATKTEAIPAKGHTVVTDAAVAATCTTEGKTEGSHCSVCSAVLKAQKTIAVLGHDWGDWTKADDQNHTRTCKRDSTHTETAAHTVVTDAAVKATCTTAGKTEGSHCSVCNGVLNAQETIAALGHDWGNWTMVDNQNHTRTCKRDSAHKETAAHSWDTGKVTTEPSCKTEGVKTYTCTDCQTTKTETIAAIGHVADSPWKTVKEATCTEAGERVRVCTRCSVEFLNPEEDDVIPALGHDYSSTWTSGGADGHYHKCIRCGAHDTPAAHSFPANTNCAEPAACTVCGYQKEAGQHTPGQWTITKEATCTADGSKKQDCTVCGQNVTTAAIPALGHDYAEDFTVDKAATCTEAGSKSKHCSRCNATTDVTEIPMTAHSFGSWTKKDETVHQHTCSVCNTTLTENHTWGQGVVTKEPTSSETGIRTFTCSACEATKTEEIPVVGKLNVWFTNQGASYYVNWTTVDLPSGEYYYVNGQCTNSSDGKLYLSDKIKSFTETSSITIGRGPYSGQTEILYTAKDAVVVDTLETPVFPIPGQASGQYRIATDWNTTGFSYYAILKGPDGAVIKDDLKTNTGLIDMAPWQGCTVDVFLGRNLISEDTSTLTLQRTPVVTVSDITFCTAPTEVTEVDSFNDLSAALRRGGPVKLINNISGTSLLSLTTGPASSLDLNGFTITAPVLHIGYGKELTIDGTVKNSAIHVTDTSGYQRALTLLAGAKVTVTGGEYQGIVGNAGVRGITLSDLTVTAVSDTIHAIQLNNIKAPMSFTNVSATAEACALHASNCSDLVIKGGSYTSTGTDFNATRGAVYIYDSGRVMLEDVTAEANRNAVNLHNCNNVTITGGSYTSNGTQSGSSDALYITECGTVSISGLKANAVTYAVDIRNNGAVTVADSNLTCISTDSYSAGCAFNLLNNTRVKMDRVTATAYYYPMKIDGSDKLTNLSIKNSSFLATAPADANRFSYGIELIRLSTATLDSVKVTGHYALKASTCSDLTLTGTSEFLGTQKDYASTIGIETSVCPNVEVNVSKVIGELRFDTRDDAVISITGGTFDKDPSSYVNTETHTVLTNTDDDGNVTYCVYTKADLKPNGWLGEQLCNGGTVVLDTDIYDVDVSMTSGTAILDLNGHNIILTGKINVASGASLTIQGNGMIRTTSDYAIYNDGGTVKINGGTIKAAQAPVYQTDGAFEMSGGTLIRVGNTYSSKCALQADRGTINIIGGTLDSGEGSSDIYITYDATVNISGGTFCKLGFHGTVVGRDNPSQVAITITGGIFASVYSYDLDDYVDLNLYEIKQETIEEVPVCTVKAKTESAGNN